MSNRAKPAKARLSWKEIYQIIDGCLGKDGEADIKKLAGHISFVEYLLDAMIKENKALKERVDIRDEMLDDSQEQIHKLLDRGEVDVDKLVREYANLQIALRQVGELLRPIKDLAPPVGRAFGTAALGADDPDHIIFEIKVNKQILEARDGEHIKTGESRCKSV